MEYYGKKTEKEEKGKIDLEERKKLKKKREDEITKEKEKKINFFLIFFRFRY